MDVLLYILAIPFAIAGWASVLFGGMAEKKPEWLWVGGGALLLVLSVLYFVGYSFGLLVGWIPPIHLEVSGR